MKHFPLLCMGALTLVSLIPSPAKADEYDKKTIITIDQATEVPGIVLEPGTYVLKLLNSSSNRHIVEIMNEKMDHLYALTFAVAAEKIDRTGKTVLTFYEGSNGRPPAMKKWFWPGDTIGQEFLYPKSQAARISAATGDKVAEGALPTVAESGQALIPDNANGLSLEARETKASEVQATVQVQETKQEAVVDVAVAEPAKAPEQPVTVIAQNVPPPPPTPQRAEETRPADAAVSAEPVVTSSPERTLPQTASNLPLIGAIGAVSLALAIGMGSVRRRRTM